MTPPGNALRPYLLDASALVKLVVAEQGSQRLKDFLSEETWFRTTTFCVVEALGVVKRKWLQRSLSEREYTSACRWLVIHSQSGGKIEAEDAPKWTGLVLGDIEQLVQTYKLDWIDALQLHVLKETFLARFVEGSRAVLITADGGLAKAARAENLLVWNCAKESAPPKRVT